MSHRAEAAVSSSFQLKPAPLFDHGYALRAACYFRLQKATGIQIGSSPKKEGVAATCENPVIIYMASLEKCESIPFLVEIL